MRQMSTSFFVLQDHNLCFVSLLLQVDNAETKGASAVLIYPDAQDYNFVADTALYGHVSVNVTFQCESWPIDEGSSQ